MNTTVSSLSLTAYPADYTIFWGYTVDIRFPVYIFIIFLYCYVVYVILTSHSSKYKSAYFRIFVVTGVADIIDAIAIEYIRFSQRVGMGPKFGWLLQITTAITGSNFAMHLIGNSLMSLFQFTACWMPIFHNDKTRILDSVLTVWQALMSGSSIVTIVGIRMKTGVSFTNSIPEKSLVLVEIVNVCFGSMETLYGFISLFNIPLTNPFLIFIFDEFVSYFFLMVCLNAFTLPLLSKSMRAEFARRLFRKNTGSDAEFTISQVFTKRT